MKYGGTLKFFYKKNSYKRNMFIEIRHYIYYLLFSDIIIQTNKLFIIRDLLNFTTKFIGGQIKAFSFIFCATSDQKSAKDRKC